MRRVSLEIRAAMLAGLLSGAVGALVFASAHSLLIVPIWDRMLGSLIFAAVTGAVAGWAFAESDPLATRELSLGGVARGVRFGALLWLAIAPATAVDALLRTLGLTTRFELLAVGAALALGVACGWALGWMLTRRRRGALAGTAAALALMFAMGGPVPVGRNARALGIFFAVLPAAVMGGAAVALLSPLIHGRMSIRPAAESDAPAAD